MFLGFDHKSRITHGISVVIFLFLISACSNLTDRDNRSIGAASHEVDPIFREYYNDLGGINVLGPAISEVFIDGNISYQYVATALLIFNPEAPSGLKFRLAPLGGDMNIAEPPVAQPQDPNAFYINGHVIDPRMLSVFEELGGRPVVGLPLTEVHHNLGKNRYEQYFENLGFYILDDDQDEKVYLLAYGVWKCGDNCLPINVGAARVILPEVIAPEFVNHVAYLGSDFTGMPLTKPAYTSDGFLEQIFENVALVIHPDEPEHLYLRAITKRLRYIPDTPGPPNNDPDYFFYPIDGGNLGYHIHRRVLEYIQRHGGQEIFGAPIGELLPVKNNLHRQCFENVCLEVLFRDDGSLFIRPNALGYSYKELPPVPFSESNKDYKGGLQQPALVQPAQEVAPQEQPADQPTPEPPTVGEVVPEPTPEPILVPAPTEPVQQEAPAQEASPTQPTSSGEEENKITIQFWVTQPMISPTANQEIGVLIYENEQPLSGIEPDVNIYLPDGRVKTLFMYRTDSAGQTSITLDPIQGENNDVVEFEVCIRKLGAQKYCVKGKFTIWQSP